MSKALFRKVDCVRLFVKDLDAALVFYRDQLGHDLVWRTASAAGLQMPDTDSEIVLQTERGVLEVDFWSILSNRRRSSLKRRAGKSLSRPLRFRSGAAPCFPIHGTTSWSSWI